MDGIYYVIKRKSDGKHVSPSGVSKAPHLYETKGRAEGQRKRHFRADLYESVQLTELKEGEQQ